MGQRKPELEYISLRKLEVQKEVGSTRATKYAYKCLKELANKALESGPFSITSGKSQPYVAPSGDVHDFLSYAPYWWPNRSGTEYIRKDGKRNPDIKTVKDQYRLESFAENFTFLCLEYYFSEEEIYAKHAVFLLNTFFLDEETKMNPNMNYAQFVRGSQNKSQLGRGEGVISSRQLSRVVNLLPLLSEFPAYRELDRPLRRWFKEYLRWLKSSPVALEAAKAENNIRTWYITQIASIHHFVDSSSDQTKKIITDFFKTDLKRQINSRTGNQLLESKRAKPFHYLAFNMDAMLFLAELAKDIGLKDVYSSNPSLHLAINYITKQKLTDDEDITLAVRCVEIMFNAVKDEDNCCRRFLGIAYKSKDSEKIEGPKNTIKLLWSMVPSNAPYFS